jgi:hypothetical protein
VIKIDPKKRIINSKGHKFGRHVGNAKYYGLIEIDIMKLGS